MRYIVFFLAVASSLFAFDCPLQIFNKKSQINCPAIVEQKTDIEDRDFLDKLNKFEDIKLIYKDILKSYLEKKDIGKYVSKKGLEEIAATQLFGKLLLAKITDNKNEYNHYLSKIDALNPYWCGALSEVKTNQKDKK